LVHDPLRKPPTLFGIVRYNCPVRALRLILFVVLCLFLLPLAVHAVWWTTREHAASWDVADWSSAALLPKPAAKADAVVAVYTARVGHWRGIFAHHTWIVVKDRGAARYTRYDKVAWGRPVRENGWAADGRWYGNMPELIAYAEGADAEALIPRMRAAVASYPYGSAGGYRVWPGPNSNTFAAHVLAGVPELKVALYPTALGKDVRTDGRMLGWSLSHTGVQLSLNGLLGVTVGWVEGLELNLLGLVSGIDVRRPALKLPGFGRIGMAAY
jgi:hypothetical protein